MKVGIFADSIALFPAAEMMLNMVYLTIIYSNEITREIGALNLFPPMTLIVAATAAVVFVLLFRLLEEFS